MWATFQNSKATTKFGWSEQGSIGLPVLFVLCLQQVEGARCQDLRTGTLMGAIVLGTRHALGLHLSCARNCSCASVLFEAPPMMQVAPNPVKL